MGKHLFRKFPLLASLLLVLQLLFPMVQVYAATTTSSASSTNSANMLPPGNLAYQLLTPSDVKLTWSSVYGATGYNVYDIDNGQMTLVGTTTGTSYTINKLPQGTYNYVVSTLSSGAESGPCAPITVNIVYPNMAAPATLTDTIQNGNDIALSWTASQYAETYNLYSIGADGSKTLVTTVAAKTSYTITNSPEGTFTYAVSAVNSLYGESPLSTALTVNVVYPTMTAPANFGYSITNGNNVNLHWNSVAYASAYKLYSVGADGSKTLLNTLTGTSVTLSNQPAGDYTYEVHSYSSRFGESADGSQLAVTVSTVTMAAPANFAYKIQNGNDIALTWGSVQYATSYNVYQISNGQKVLKSTVTGTGVTYTNQPAGDYTFEVHSNSSTFGESADGSQVSFTLDPITMAAPANLTSSVQNLNNIAMSWGSVPYATAYKVYQVVNGQKVLKTTTSGTSLTYSNQLAGDYTFEVHSYSDRFGESVDGNQTSVTIAVVTMTAPTNLADTIKNGNDIDLSWDAAANADSYKIYQVSNGQKTLKATVTSTAAVFSNQPGGDYTYEVHSYSSRFGESADGSQVSLTLVPPTMQAPANVVQSITGASSFTLNWEPADYATGYRVYQIVNGQKVLKSSPSGTSVGFSNMSPGDYTYEVHSYSSRFGESVDGTQLTFTLNGQTLNPPTGLTDSITNGNDITLKWTAAQYATSYKIYQVIAGEKLLKSTTTSTAIAYSNQAAGDYDFVVDSVSSLFGESPNGAEVTFSLVYPTMADPANLTAKVQNGNDVALSWSSVPYATSYKVYELVDGQENLVTTVTTVAATISNVAAGDHTYVVHSSSSRFGDSAAGSQVALTLDQVIMQAPANFTQSIVNGNDIVLRWSAATYANSYKVYQIVDGQKVLKTTTTGASVTFANQPEGDYTFEVDSSSTRYGDSPQGSQVSLTLVFPTMQAPTALKESTANGNDIVLSWTGAAYANTYKVYQIVDGQKVLKTTTSGTSVAYTNMPAGDYTYEVHSYSSRFGESPVGSTVSFTLVWPVVQPPVLKDSIANVNNITLSWNAVQWANEYHVYETSNGTRTLIYKGTSLSTQIFNLSQAVHSYVVTAYNTRFGESADSNEITENIIYPVMQPPAASLKLTSNTSAVISWSFATYANGYNIYEIVDGQPVAVAKMVNNLSYTLNNLTYANHQYYVTSVSNSFGESKPSNTVIAQLIIDTTPPVTTASAPTDWTNQSAVVNFSATDDITGVAATYFSLNGGAYVQGTSVTVSDEGVNNISYYSVDKAGNKEASKTIAVKIDKTAPTTQASTVPDWSNQPVTLQFTAADDASGVAATYYSVNGSDYAAGTSVTVDQVGTNTVSYYSVDKAGNIEAAHTQQVKIDKTAPVTTATAPTNWSKDDVTVNFSATDDASGVANTYYSINGASYVAGTTATVSQEGINQVSYYSVDNAGNVEQAKTIEVKIDKTAPVTTTDAPSTWSKDDVTVNLTATDALSGVAKTYYSINGSAYTEGTNFTVNQEGVNTVSYYSVDQVGNVEQTQTVNVKIDKTAPTTASDAPSTWSNADVTVNLTATDALSGVAKTYYSINGSDFTEGTSLTVSQEGVNKVSYYSVDVAGNVEQTQTVNVKIDKTAPTTASDAPTAWNKGDVTVNLNATDALSGVANTYYSIDGAAYVAGTSFTIQSEGIHTISYYSVDVAGNKETAQTAEVKIDKTPPVAAMDLNSEYKLGTQVQLNYTATDNLSGVAAQTMTVTGPNAAGVQTLTNGSTLTLDKPGTYTVTVTVTDAAGWTTTLQKQFVVYIPATVTVTPTVIKGNSGVFTVRVDLPSGYSTSGFDLNSATLNGVHALTSNNGYYNQAQNGQFKFERSNFPWNTQTVTVEFRGYDNGYLVVGQTTVKVQQ